MGWLGKLRRPDKAAARTHAALRVPSRALRSRESSGRRVYPLFAEVSAIAKSNGITWPDELERAVRTYLDDAGLPLPGPSATA